MSEVHTSINMERFIRLMVMQDGGKFREQWFNAKMFMTFWPANDKERAAHLGIRTVLIASGSGGPLLLQTEVDDIIKQLRGEVQYEPTASNGLLN